MRLKRSRKYKASSCPETRFYGFYILSRIKTRFVGDDFVMLSIASEIKKQESL